MMDNKENRRGRVSDIVLRYGLLSLLVWTPLAFGAVHAWAYGLLQIHICLLVVIWMSPYLIAWRQRQPVAALAPRFVGTPLALPLVCFLILLGFQQLPLPVTWLSTLSPKAAELYNLFLPGWPERLGSLSLAPHSTKTALGQCLAYTGLFFLCVNILRTRHTIRSVCGVIVGTGCVMAVIGLLQEASGTDAIYWFRDTSYATGRFFGPYINRNHFAGYQVMAIILGLGLLLTQPSKADVQAPLRWRHRLFHWFGLLSPGRLLLIFSLSLMTGAMVLSASRGGAMSFTLGLLFLGLLFSQHRLELNRRIVFALSFMSMAGMVIWFGAAPLLARFEQLASNSPTLLWSGRLAAFQAAWDISKDFPLFGIGYNAFPMLSTRYQPINEINLRFVHVHNDWLQLLAETGWIGAGLLVGGILLVIRAIFLKWRTRHDPFVRMMTAAGLSALVAMGLHSLVDFNLHIPANTLLFTTVLAMTCACSHLPSRKTGEPEDSVMQTARPGRTAILAVLALLITSGLGVGSVRRVVADLLYPQEQVWQSSHWVHQVTPMVERQRLQQAMQWTPDNPWYWRRFAALEMQAARMGQASDHTTEAARQLTIDTLQRAANAYEYTLQKQPTDPYTQLDWLNVQLRLMRLQPHSQSLSMADLKALYHHIASLAPAHANVQYALGVAILTAETDGLVTMSPQPFFRQAIRLDAKYIPKIFQAYLRLLPEREARQRFAGTLPNTAEAHQQAARILEDSHWQQAHLHYQTALILSQSDPEILQVYASALMRQEVFDIARDIWLRLKEKQPDQAGAYLGLAKALGHLKDREGVVQTLQQLVARYPQDASYQTQLARAYERQDRLREAETTWKTALDLQPYDVQSYVGLARLYETQEQLGQAIQMMQRAVNLAPDDAKYQQTLARLYEQSGYRDQALKIYQRLAAHRADDPHTFYKLGTYAQQQGHLTRAVAYYRRALRLSPGNAGFRKALDGALQQSAKYK
ncbi:O-antigen ligase family protein [Candidatus Entotheonella palauensis]|uniref:O-antigen ligase family protein n=1 Tax=Candidatus Entotheonella palauensis TaxID=93172 RepID=UPI000B7D37A8|nr:O-antigen ligase family protein [Candidatus Entotheonella palauensis]